MKDLLPEYAAGALPAAQRRRVEDHLAGCSDCRAEVAAWIVVADAAGRFPGSGGDARWQAPPAAPAMVRAVLARSASAGSGAPPGRRRGLPPALLVAEARLVRPSLLVASTLVIAFAVIVAAARPVPGVWAGDILALIAPVVAAAGIAMAYPDSRDPVFELTAATPTSPRLLLLVRVTLVFGYDLLLALAASLVLTAAGVESDGLHPLIVAWLGPLALLSALSLVLAVWLGPDVAVGTVLALWASRVLVDSPLVDAGWLAALVHAAWSTSPAGALVTAALVVVAVIIAGRGEPIRRSRATHLT